MKSSDSDDDETNQNQPRNQKSSGSMLQGDSLSESEGVGVAISSTNESSPAVVVHTIDALDDSVDLPDYVKENQATLSFPEKVRFSIVLIVAISFCILTIFVFKLMITMIHVERECAKLGKRPADESIGWVLDGKAFVIWDKERFTKTWVPLFFGQAKLSSFTRKLYRWGFRKLNLSRDGTGNTHNAMYFGNENFQRDNTFLLSRMRSITAAKTRTETALDTSHNAHMIGASNGNHSQLSLPTHVMSALDVLLSSIVQPMPATNPSLLQDTRAVEALSVMQQLGTNPQALGPPVPFPIMSALHQGMPTAPIPLNNPILQSINSLTTMGVRDSTGIDQIGHLLGQLQHFYRMHQPFSPFLDQRHQQQHLAPNLQTVQSYLLSTNFGAQLPAGMPQPIMAVPQISQGQNPGMASLGAEMHQHSAISTENTNPSSERDVINEIINMLHRYNQTLETHPNPPRQPPH